MKEPINFLDHVVEYPNRYTVENDGTYETLTKAPGTIVQQGTPLNASNFNDVDLGGIEGILTSLVGAQRLLHLSQKVEALEGLAMDVTLTNSQPYPFNNSIQTVGLTGDLRRNNADYTVLAEIVSNTGGGVGEIRITDKLLNGFKIEYTGAASSVALRLYIQGGI